MPAYANKEPILTGDELFAIRLHLGLSQEQFGRLIGYEGAPESLRVHVLKLEHGHRNVRSPQALLALAYLSGWRPAIYPEKSSIKPQAMSDKILARLKKKFPNKRRATDIIGME